jgi:NAD(P)-dependent dehydrogenase (short-subunit alcohol dehydrogenase family)
VDTTFFNSGTTLITMEGKVIAITGGASGIGLSTAKVLAQRKAKLSLCDVSDDALKSVLSTLESVGANGDDILIAKVDVREKAQLTKWLRDTVDKFGKLDGAANMAGIAGKTYGTTPLVEEEDESNWEAVIGINLTVSPVTCDCYT